jgi:predicted small metal-binding protein
MAEERDLRFRCADVGDPNCKWETRGKSEEEVMRDVERHGREAHDLHMSDDLKNRVRSKIRPAA